MKKWHKRILYTGLIAALLYAVWFYYTQPHFWKELDPAKPGFDVTKFRFEDYPSTKELKYVLETLFPEGSSVEEFENFLLQDGFFISNRKECQCPDKKSFNKSVIGGRINSLEKFIWIYHPQVSILTFGKDNTLTYSYISRNGGEFLYDKRYKHIFSCRDIREN